MFVTKEFAKQVGTFAAADQWQCSIFEFLSNAAILLAIVDIQRHPYSTYKVGPVDVAWSERIRLAMNCVPLGLLVCKLIQAYQ